MLHWPTKIVIVKKHGSRSKSAMQIGEDETLTFRILYGRRTLPPKRAARWQGPPFSDYGDNPIRKVSDHPLLSRCQLSPFYGTSARDHVSGSSELKDTVIDWFLCGHLGLSKTVGAHRSQALGPYRSAQ